MDKTKTEKVVADLEWLAPGTAIEYFDDSAQVVLWRYRDRLMAMVIDRDGRRSPDMEQEVLRIGNEYRDNLRQRG